MPPAARDFLWQVMRDLICIIKHYIERAAFRTATTISYFKFSVNLVLKMAYPFQKYFI